MADELRVKECLEQGIACMQAMAYEDALEFFLEATKEDPQNAEAFIHLGNAYANLEKYDNAISAFKTSLMYDEENAGMLYFSMGNASLLNNDVAGAMKYYSRAEEAGYESIRLHNVRSRLYEDAGEYFQAIREISKSIALEPLRGELYNRKIELQLKADMGEDALETLAEYNAMLPDALESYDTAVTLYCARGEYDKAFEIADKGIALYPEDPAIRHLRLKVLTQSGRFEDALGYADEMLKMDSVETGILKNVILCKVQALEALNREDELEKVLEEYNAAHADQETLYLQMTVYLKKQNYERVKELTEKMQQSGENIHFMAAAKFHHADAVMRLKGIDAARDEYRQLINELRRMNVKDASLYEVYIYRLISHLAIDETEQAMKLADFIGKAYPNLPDSHMYKYQIYLKMGEKEKAEEERQAALKINPDLPLR